MRCVLVTVFICELVFARAEVEDNGKVVHIYDIPNSQITEQIENIRIDTSIKEQGMRSKNIDAADTAGKRQEVAFKRAAAPVLNKSKSDTIAAVNAQIKFLFHKPLDVSSISLDWKDRQGKTTLLKCIDKDDTLLAMRILLEHTPLKLDEAKWLTKRVWSFWKTNDLHEQIPHDTATAPLDSAGRRP
ncbi:MAG: hypothetical protein PHC61_13440 [Chitinivibrionales bacterium]|nr:hypothetical protein [Chitinivibrionales bacterium]